MAPCFITELIKKSMQAHGIGRAPGPCGDAGNLLKLTMKFGTALMLQMFHFLEAFCGCWCQVLFCTPCTLGVIYREAKSKPVYK